MLKQRELLPPQVLFAVSGPQGDAPRRHAVGEIVDRLQEAGVAVVDYAQKQRIIEFAAA
jgi:nucleoside diphosphate kinase